MAIRTMDNNPLALNTEQQLVLNIQLYLEHALWFKYVVVGWNPLHRLIHKQAMKERKRQLEKAIREGSAQYENQPTPLLGATLTIAEHWLKVL